MGRNGRIPRLDLHVKTADAALTELQTDSISVGDNLPLNFL